MSSPLETSEVKRKDLDFDPLHETWGIFKLRDDETILRARIVLIRCWETLDGKQGQLETSVEMTAVAPESVREQLSSEVSQPERVVKTYRPADWIVERPAESSYHLSNQTVLSLLATPVEIKRYNRSTKGGDPVLQAGWQAAVSSKKIG